MDAVLRGPEDVRAAGAMVARAVAMAPDTVVRLKAPQDQQDQQDPQDSEAQPAPRPLLQLAAWLPHDVLIARSVEITVPAPGLDHSVSGVELLSALEGIRDTGGALGLASLPPAWWSGALPPTRGWEVREILAGEVVVELSREAAEALSSVGEGGSVATQHAGTTMLAQPVLTVTDSHGEVRVPLRAVLAASRMGFVAGGPVRVATAPGWSRLDATYGSCFVRDGAVLAIRPVLGR